MTEASGSAGAIANDPAFTSLAELGAALRARSISPVELTEIAIQRLATTGAELRAVVTITEDRARREARAAEAEIAAGYDRGPLHGIPYGAKDLLAAAGAPTTWGAGPLREQRFDEDAAVVRALTDAGAILAAKMTMSELAAGLDNEQAEGTFTGAARNPWNRTAYTGGSTTGGSAAVAAGCIPYTIGSETWGSILDPAAFTGLTGIRPTYGLVSRRGAMASSWSLDKVGPLARNAEDCALVLEAIAGPDPLDPGSAGRRCDCARPPANRRYRLGAYAAGAATARPDVRANFRAALAALEDVATFEEILLPDLPYVAVCWTIMVAEAASAFEDLIASGAVADLVSADDRIGGFVAEAIPATAYLKAQRIRRRIRRELTELTGSFDAIVAPTSGRVAPPLEGSVAAYYGTTGQSLLTPAGNVAGLPAVTVPTGFGERGLPTAMQFMGAPFTEARLLDLARAYQQRTDWHRRIPSDCA